MMIVQPFGITLRDWASALVQDFPDENVPILYNEDDWRSWGNSLTHVTAFLNNSIPGTDAYNDWIAWAESVFYCMQDSI